MLYYSLIITNFIITITYTTLTSLGTVLRVLSMVMYVSSHKNPKIDVIGIPISQVKKLRSMEVERAVLGYTAS